MNKRSNNNLIEEMKLILRDKTPSLTVESLVFGEGNDPMADVDQLPPDFDERMAQGQQQMDDRPFQSAEDEKMAQNVSPIDAEIKPLIDKIRILVLQGISKLANNPTSPSYKLLKDIFLKIDKAAENANKPENDNQNV